MPDPRALVFDVFGTVVDWHSAVVRDGEALGREKHLDVDWAAFADAWVRGREMTLQAAIAYCQEQTANE